MYLKITLYSYNKGKNISKYLVILYNDIQHLERAIFQTNVT